MGMCFLKIFYQDFFLKLLSRKELPFLTGCGCLNIIATLHLLIISMTDVHLDSAEIIVIHSHLVCPYWSECVLFYLYVSVSSFWYIACGREKQLAIIQITATQTPPCAGVMRGLRGYKITWEISQHTDINWSEQTNN